MNKTYKYTLTAHEKKEISFDTGVARLAIANGDGVDGSTTVVMSEITKQHSGNIVSFIDGADAPFADFKINIVAVQSGSGVPSPDNERPIIGWTGANAYVSDEDTSNPTTYNVEWENEAGTVYGGYCKLLTGELVATHEILDIGLTEHIWRKGNYAFYVSVPSMKNNCDVICSCYKSNKPTSGMNMPDFSVNSNEGAIYLKDSNLMQGTVAEMREALTGQKIVYELATPITYQLTPVEIRSLLGVNNVWADCGPVDVWYFVQSTQPMIDYIDDKTENVVEVFKATDNGGGVYTLDDITCDELCLYARTHSNIVLKVARYNSAIAYDIFILSDYIGTSAVFRHTMITSAIGGSYVLYVRELQADSTTATNVLTTRDVNITADT